MGSEWIRRDTKDFEQSVVRLGDTISKASTLWCDKKYAELSNAVRNIAVDSKQLIEAGDKCCSQIDKFMSIAAEKY